MFQIVIQKIDYNILSYFIFQSFNFIDKIFPFLSASQYYLDAIKIRMKFNNDNGYANLRYDLYDQ